MFGYTRYGDSDSLGVNYNIITGGVVPVEIRGEGHRGGVVFEKKTHRRVYP